MSNPRDGKVGEGVTSGGTRDADLEAPSMRGLAGGPGAPVAVGHPKGLYLLFVTEMWERFSYYGMKAFLILYMTAAVATGGLGWNKEQAASLYGWYTAFVYLTPILGGYLADRYFGTHRSMIVGGLIISAGHFCLAFETTTTFYMGLLLIVIGTGFFKPCASVMVGQLYAERDPRRDAAYTVFYLGINLGAFLGPLVCGGLRVGQKHGEVFGWSWAFGAAGVGMVLGLICYSIGRPFLLKGIGLPVKRSGAGAVYADDMMCGKCGESLKGVPHGGVCPKCRASTVTTMPVKRPLTREEKQGITAIFIMAFFVLFFWPAFEQSGSSMNLFAEERTDRSMTKEVAQRIYDWGTKEGTPISSWAIAGIGAVLLALWIGWEMMGRGKVRSTVARIVPKIVGLALGSILLCLGIFKATGYLKEGFFPDNFVADAQYPADWFQSVNPFFILVLAPIFASLWVRLAKKGKEPSTPVKFALGLIMLGIGFIFMVLGAQASEAGGPDKVAKVGGLWLCAAYCVHTMGELCLSPVGLSMVNKLAPAKFVSVLMGVWFVANFVSNKLAAWLAGKEDWFAKHEVAGLHGHALFYAIFVVFPIGAGVVLLAISPVLKKLMQGRA